MNTAEETAGRDRRSCIRHDVSTALRIRAWKKDVAEHRAQSINISFRGIYFATKTPLYEGEIVEVFLKMPEVVTGEPATEWRCTGHVVRVEPPALPEGKLEIGVQFYCYDVSRPERPPLTFGGRPSWRAILQAEQGLAMKSADANAE
jgi:PilZ domain